MLVAEFQFFWSINTYLEQCILWVVVHTMPNMFLKIAFSTVHIAWLANNPSGHEISLELNTNTKTALRKVLGQFTTCQNVLSNSMCRAGKWSWLVPAEGHVVQNGSENCINQDNRNTSKIPISYYFFLFEKKFKEHRSTSLKTHINYRNVFKQGPQLVLMTGLSALPMLWIFPSSA